MKIPVTLKHKPVVVVEDYGQIDGRYQGNSDAKGLSLGLAQWNDRRRLEISGKVWRHTGGKWSRQSEELPLHRILDLAIMVCEAKKYFSEAYRYEKLYDPKNPLVNKVALQGSGMEIGVCVENEMIDEDIQIFRDALSQDDELIGERLARLAEVLKKLGYIR
jgi:hypothetical protein